MGTELFHRLPNGIRLNAAGERVLRQPSLTCNSTTLLKRLIASGQGISFFPKLAFLDELAHGEVVWRPLEDESVNALTVGVIAPNHARCRTLPSSSSAASYGV